MKRTLTIIVTVIVVSSGVVTAAVATDDFEDGTVTDDWVQQDDTLTSSTDSFHGSYSMEVTDGETEQHGYWDTGPTEFSGTGSAIDRLASIVTEAINQ